MKLVSENPYRITGLLVGATAKVESRQIKRLLKYLEAEQEPETDFNFPALKEIHRTVEKVEEATAKLTLSSDKITAALFWFYNGNTKTDEPVFDLLKEGELTQAIITWMKHSLNNEVSKSNASAFHNLGTLYLSGIMDELNNNAFEQGISLKLKFLESDFVQDFKILVATDEDYKITKKELQLLFLNQVQNEIEISGVISSDNFLKILSKQDFSAKVDFFKGFVQKPIEQIVRKIEEIKKKQKTNPENAGEYGSDLFETTKDLVFTIISILGETDIKSITISDKLANEILQCSISFFNYFYETEREVGEIALDLNEKAESIALGSIVKARINESTPILIKYINQRSEREKIKLIKSELEFVKSNLERFQDLPDTIFSAKDLIANCKPKLLKIKQIFGSTDKFYLNLSSEVVQNTQNMIVNTVNKEMESSNDFFSSLSNRRLEKIKAALDTTFKLGTFDMDTILKSHYTKNLDGLKLIAKQLGISILTPKEELQNELRRTETRLKEIQNTTYLKLELLNTQNEMTKIKEWHFLRIVSERENQINKQQQKINSLIKKSDTEKTYQTTQQIKIINEIKTKIQNAEY